LIHQQEPNKGKIMKSNELAVGQIITIGTEAEWWNYSDGEALDYRADRWAPFEILEILTRFDDYVTLNLICRDGIWEREIELDVDVEDIELVK
jgi:hypothetical protein